MQNKALQASVKELQALLQQDQQRIEEKRSTAKQLQTDCCKLSAKVLDLSALVEAAKVRRMVAGEPCGVISLTHLCVGEARDHQTVY